MALTDIKVRTTKPGLMLFRFGTRMRCQFIISKLYLRVSQLRMVILLRFGFNVSTDDK